MQKILFVETLLDYQTSLAYLRQNLSDCADLTIVNLNTCHVMDYSGANVKYKTENDYIGKNTLQGINQSAEEIACAWFLDLAMRPFLEIEGWNLGLILENYLVRELIAVFKYARLLRVILDREQCQSLILIDYPCGISRVRSLLPGNDEKILNGVVEALGTQLAMQVQTIDSLDFPKEAPISGAVLVKKAVEPLANVARSVENWVLERGKSRKQAIALAGAPRLIFPLIEELKKQDDAQVVYFQNDFGPRMMQRLMRVGTKYKVTSDYKIPGEEAERSRLENELVGRLENLMVAGQFHALLTFEGVDLSKAVMPWFRHAFEEFLPDILVNMRRFKRFFKEQRIGVVVIDESVTQFSRPLVIAAKSCGIKSIEIQHGIPGSYVHPRLVTSKLAVWGEYCRSRYVVDSRLREEEVVATGSPTLDKLKLRDCQKDNSFVRQSLRVASKDRIITLAPPPMHRGSRGGIIDEHFTREQLEFAYGETLSAVDSMDNIHLVIKLHHTDPDTLYVREFIKKVGFRKPCSVVQTFDIYPLIKCSELLLSLGSTTILEAMVMGVPVVLLDYWNRQDLDPYAKWGALISVTQPGELKNTLKQMLVDRERHERLTQKGRERVLRELACDADGQSGMRYIALIKDLIKQSAVAANHYQPA